MAFHRSLTRSLLGARPYFKAHIPANGPACARVRASRVRATGKGLLVILLVNHRECAVSALEQIRPGASTIG